MKYLFDTNIFLDILLGREYAKLIQKAILHINANEIAISDFSLFSLGIYLDRNNMGEFFQIFIKDMILNGGMEIISLPLYDLLKIPEICASFHLDFDDAYQYQVTKVFNLKLVSRDKDFDRTPEGRIKIEEFRY